MDSLNRKTQRHTFVSGGKVRAIVDSTDASPIVIQSTGHNFSTGDRVTINGHLTNVAANGTWIITKVDANNFSLNGSTGSGAGAGGATGCVSDYIKPMLVKNFRHLLVSIATDGGGDAAMTVKCVGSIQDTDNVPDFAADRSVTNHFDFIQMIDKQASGTGLDGDTGFVVASADDYRIFEVNVNALIWLCFLPTAGSEGEITIKCEAFQD